MANAITKQAPAPKPWTNRVATNMIPDQDSAQAAPAALKQASPANNTGRRPWSSERLPPPSCPNANPTMNSDTVRPATVRDVPSACGRSASVGALTSTDNDGSAANKPKIMVNAKDFGFIRTFS
jgi:hypothetical protein